MRKLKKRLMLGAAALICALSFSSSASAASYQSGTLGGYSVSGSVYMGSNSASATTTSGTLASLYSRIEYTYYYDNYQTDTVNNYQANGSTSVTASTSAKYVSVISRWAYGTHSVTIGTQSWNASTSTL